MEKKEKYTIDRLLKEGLISSREDLTGDGEPSKMLNFLVAKYGYLLNGDPTNLLSHKEILFREYFTKLIKVVGPLALKNKQVIENRNTLKNANDITPDLGINLPNHPVIWMPNHGFKDDPLATALAIKRNAYYLFASLPQFYNSFDGILAANYGVIMMNRKVKKSRQSVIPNCVYALNQGKDLIIYPEAVLNKTSNKLILELWSGIYRICCETGSPIVPVIHYLRDMGPKTLKRKLFPTEDDIIHTVIDEPVNIINLPEKAALEYLRDILATWKYLLMERYGKDTRNNITGNYANINDAWMEALESRKATMDFYDTSIEISADYRDKYNVSPEDVYQKIADLDVYDQNGNIRLNIVKDIAYANQLVRQRKLEDFQRRI